MNIDYDTTDLATAAQHNIQAGLGQNTTTFQQDLYLNDQQNEQSYPSNPSIAGTDSTYPPPFDPTDQQTENRVWHNSRDALNHQRDNLQRGLELNDSGEKLSFNFLLESLGQRAGSAPTQQVQRDLQSGRESYPLLAQQPADQPQTSWTTLPKNCTPTCPLDSILLNFLQARRRDAGSGGSSNSLTNPAYPSVSSLLNPTGNFQVDPLSRLMADIISKFPNISGLPEQTAVLYIMFVVMRWQLHPTAENYEKIPDWMTPRPSQLFTSHPAWIDHLPWPSMRDKVVARYQEYQFENWFIPFTTGLSLNWPYDPIDCLLSTGEKDDPMINPVFERHLRRIENWSLGPEFAETFPELVETCSIRPSTQKRSIKDMS